MKCLSIFGSVFFCFHLAFAQEATPTPSPSPSPTPFVAPLIVPTGNSIELDFKDGRVAALYQAIGKVIETKLGMKQIENTCQPDQVMAFCEMHLDVASYGQYVRWVQHPDATKVGQVVEYAFNQTTPKIDFQKFENDGGFHFWYSTFVNPEYRGNFRPDQLSCTNLNWLNALPNVGDIYSVSSWTGEQMSFTPEINAVENQTVSGSFNMQLQKLDDKNLRIAKVGFSKGDFLPPYLSSQTVSLIAQKATGPCQITFEIDIQAVARDISDPTFRKIDLSTQKSISSPDILLSFGIGSSLKYLFQPGLLKEVR